MPHYDTKALFHIYPYLDAGEYRDTLMGSVVKYPDLPTEQYVPRKSAVPPWNTVSGLNLKPINVPNIKFLTHKIKDANLLSLLDVFVDTFFQSSDETTITAARLWHMDSAGKTFQELLKNKSYSRPLINLLRSCHNQEGYFITDMVTLFRADGIKPRIARAYQLVGAVRSQDSAIPPGQAHSKTYSPAYYEGETIVFIGYHRVMLERSDSILAKLARVLFDQYHGFTVRDGSDYWPQRIQKPVAKSETRLSKTSGRDMNSVKEQSVPPIDDHTKIIRELGFDIEIVG